MSKKDPFAAPSRMYPSKKVEDQVAETAEEVEEAPVEEKTQEVPSGTITEIREWVGEDVERAQAALEAEEASDHPRVTLVEYLKDKVNS